MSEKPLKVVVTGAYGLVGNLVYQHLMSQPALYEVYGSDRAPVVSERVDDTKFAEIPPERYLQADLSNFDAVKQLVSGMEAVVALGANPSPTAPFEDILSSNVVGIRNLLAACVEEGVKRLVFASSIMVNWGYFEYEEPYVAIRERRLQDIPDPIPMIKHTDPVRSVDAYSSSKVWGEALCRAYVDRHDMSIICMRIGGVNRDSQPLSPFYFSLYCSHHDIVRFFEAAL